MTTKDMEQSVFLSELEAPAYCRLYTKRWCVMSQEWASSACSPTAGVDQPKR